MTTNVRDDEDTRVTTGTIRDLPNPLARAYGLAMTIGLVVDLIDAEEADTLLALLTLTHDDRGDRDVVLIANDLGDDLKAEAIFFAVSLVSENRDAGLGLGRWAKDGPEGIPFIAVSRERVDPTESGFGRLAVEMSKAAGLEHATSFMFFDPSDPEQERLIP